MTITSNKPNVDDLVCMTVIAGRKLKQPLLKAIVDGGGKLVNIEFAKGSTHVSSLSEAFGFKPENKKVVFTCLMRKEASNNLFEVLNEDFDFNEPNTGIAYTISVDGLSF